MKLKILHKHLIKLSENLLSTDTGTHAQKQKKILDLDHQDGTTIKLPILHIKKTIKLPKPQRFYPKKTNFE